MYKNSLAEDLGRRGSGSGWGCGWGERATRLVFAVERISMAAEAVGDERRVAFAALLVAVTVAVAAAAVRVTCCWMT